MDDDFVEIDLGVWAEDASVPPRRVKVRVSTDPAVWAKSLTGRYPRRLTKLLYGAIAVHTYPLPQLERQAPLFAKENAQ